MSLECKVQVFLNNLTPQKSDSIRKALTPDNINFPENLSMEIENVNNSLIFTFQSKGNIRTLISTIDEVLEHAQVVLRVTG
ncbi:MAG: KEOPS complex subunit Pcc1 [Nitrosopumilaceae archaeon]